MSLVKMCKEKKKKPSDLQSIPEPSGPRLWDPQPLLSPLLRSTMSGPFHPFFKTYVFRIEKALSLTFEMKLSLIQNKRNTN